MSVRIKSFTTLALLMIMFSGCSIVPSPEKTIVPPKSVGNISSGNDSTSSIIAGFLEKSSKLIKLEKDEGSGPVFLEDLDGDGTKEIITTYCNEEKFVKTGVIVLRKGKESWYKLMEYETDYGSNPITNLFFKDITGDSFPEIIMEITDTLVLYHYYPSRDKLVPITGYNDVFTYEPRGIKFKEYKIEDIQNHDGKDGMTELLILEEQLQVPHYAIYRWMELGLYSVEDEYPYYCNFNSKAALDVYINKVQLSPTFSPSWVDLAYEQKHQGMYKEALESIEKAIKLNNSTDRNYQLVQVKASILIELKRYKEAGDLLMKNSMEKTYLMAQIYFNQKDYEKAKEIYRLNTRYIYDESLQKCDSAKARDILFDKIEENGPKDLLNFKNSLMKTAEDNDIVLNYVIPENDNSNLPQVVIIDYHIDPSKAYGKENVGSSLICWWENGVLKYICYPLAANGLYYNRIASLEPSSAKMFMTGRDIKLEVTYRYSKDDKYYPETFKQVYLYKNNSWKLVWK